jgi:glucose-1-phosphate thymidylyltransferase
MPTCGIVLAGGNGTRLFPITKSVNKHLIPIYDKPMIYYAISTLMMTGIRRIAIVTREIDSELFKNLLGDGSRFGISITYLTQDYAKGIPDAFIVAEHFIGHDNIVLALGDNILVGQGLGKTLESALHHSGAHIFAFPVNNPEDYGIVTIDSKTDKIIKIEEKPKFTKSKLAVPGLYFTDNNAVSYAKELKPSARGEIEITQLLDLYLKDEKLSVSVFKRGIGWMDAGSVESLYSAGELIGILQKRQGMQFANLEEIGWRNGWISDSDLVSAAGLYLNSPYGDYLRGLANNAK